MSSCLFWSGLAGLTAVILGAFGAHALKAALVERGMLEVWQTAVLYHLVHAVAALAAGLAIVHGNGRELTPLIRRLRAACHCWLAGIFLFSGSLYLMAGLGVQHLGWVTPLGGVLFLAGWAFVLAAGWKKSDSL